MERILPQNLATYIYDMLLLKIMIGSWKKGDTLPSRRRLAHEYGVSEITVRAALQMLAANRLIVMSKGKEPVVAFDLKKDEYADFYWSFMSKRVSALVDVLYANTVFFSRVMIYAAGRCTEQRSNELKAVYRQYVEAENRDIVVYFSRFWTTLLCGLHNDLLLGLYDQMNHFTGLFAMIFEPVLLNEFKAWSKPYMETFFRGMARQDVSIMKSGLDQIYNETTFAAFAKETQKKLNPDNKIEQIPFYWFIKREPDDLTQSVIQFMVKKIEVGEYQIGDELPSIHELREQFQISAKTARKVFDFLEMAGIIESHQGRKSKIIKREAVPMNLSSASMTATEENIKEILQAREILFITHETLVDEFYKTDHSKEMGHLKNSKFSSANVILHQMIGAVSSPALRHIYSQLENIIVRGSFFKQSVDAKYYEMIHNMENDYYAAVHAYLHEGKNEFQYRISRILKRQYLVTADFVEEFEKHNHGIS